MSGREKGRRARPWILGVILAVGVGAALDPSGLRRYVVLSREVTRMRMENSRLAAENSALAHEVSSLQRDPAALERAAREELKFIRPGERVYWLGTVP